MVLFYLAVISGVLAGGLGEPVLGRCGPVEVSGPNAEALCSWPAVSPKNLPELPPQGIGWDHVAPLAAFVLLRDRLPWAGMLACVEI